ncbi:uncharacterized protein LOC126737660 [Anthonomus grandis grandis]|uniref:uncharacterized protein LOC126737660 n=1 Tax=Anthonomus grandis grandis TaxID=2921223 RepID=UPI0021653B41|nr:uncharacterized protein LOC126737660 [Anthonomus grandis grandis]XP_050298605.1 uncharacterized protein LOC126737660 [Anthonomus grandis grandis]XP_050298606.1 uncharacterized protein LOC126737660 [Anthonomus grandis grandis]
MSRRSSNQQPRFARPDHNPYQVTTLAPPRNRPSGYNHHYSQKRCQRKPGKYPPQTTIDIGFSDATTTDTYYDYCEQDGSTFQHSPLRESRATDVTFSDDSGSTRLPYYEFDDESNNGCSRNSFSEHSFRQAARLQRQDRIGKHEEDMEEEEEWEERLYHEIQTPCDNGPTPVTANGRRLPLSRLSDRPQSSMSSALTNAMVYGCGGKCQTFETICYFVLQLIFTMGILIGVSLCIAGLVLRKSAARNLQVLVYIGVMLAMVSAFLLTIQCRAKNTARRRIKAIQSAKRAPIQMEQLNVRHNPMYLERLPSVRENQRLSQLPQVHNAVTRPLPQRPRRLSENQNSLVEEPGIPWWRRREVIHL